jgi:hypothetical protein
MHCRSLLCPLQMCLRLACEVHTGQRVAAHHSAGVLLNVLFPNWLLTFLLTALLLWLTVRIGRKAARLYKVGM